mmetsp:Transcript_25239/g.64162  ORF Transcript_25239/g.64162 Transcript_25239/m.64162 type:complete len:237 (-) Transcript_25239:613-1323(-)
MFWRHEGPEELCLVVLARRTGVQEDLEQLLVAVLDEGLTEEGNRVVEEVRRDVAHPQASIRRLRAEPIREGGANLGAETFAPCAVRLVDPHWRHALEIVQSQQAVLRGVFRRRGQRYAAFVHPQGLGQVAMVPEEPAQVVVGLRIRGVHLDRTGEILQRLLQLAHRCVRNADIVQRLREAGVALQRFVVALESLVQILLLLVNDTHVVVGLCTAGVEVDREVVVDEGFVVLVHLGI